MIKIKYHYDLVNCECCGSFDDYSIYVSGDLIQNYLFCDHLGPSPDQEIDGWGSPLRVEDWIQGYVRALRDLGYNVEVEDVSSNI